MSKELKKKRIDLSRFLPTPEELEKIQEEVYLNKLNDKNNFSYWFPKIKNCGIKVPESVIIPLTKEWYKWLESDNYQPEKIKEFSEFILGKLKESGFNTNRTLFIKNNDFSGKFYFNNCCKVDNLNKIGDNFVLLNYESLLVGAGNATEVVIREFIKNNKDIPTIYKGMPLNTEFRLFYDFDTHEVVTICNYWDKETMENSLPKFSDDGSTYRQYANTLVDNFEKYKDMIVDVAKKYLVNVHSLCGIWSVDFMYVNDEVYLIDMATAETSYYRERIIDYAKEKEMVLNYIQFISDHEQANLDFLNHYGYTINENGNYLKDGKYVRTAELSLSFDEFLGEHHTLNNDFERYMNHQ